MGDVAPLFPPTTPGILGGSSSRCMCSLNVRMQESMSTLSSLDDIPAGWAQFCEADFYPSCQLQSRQPVVYSQMCPSLALSRNRGVVVAERLRLPYTQTNPGQITRAFFCCLSCLYLPPVPPCSSAFRGIAQAAVFPSAHSPCFPDVHQALLEELYPQQDHPSLLPRRKNSAFQCRFSSISLLVLVSVKCTSRCTVTPAVSPTQLVPAKCTTQYQLFPLSPSKQLDGGGSPLMKDSGGLKTALCLLPSYSPSIHHCLTDLLSLQTTSTSSERHPRCGREGLPLCQARGQISLHPHTQSSERSSEQHARQMLHLLFHSEYTQGAESRHAVRSSHAPPSDGDWPVAVVTTGRQAQ